MWSNMWSKAILDQSRGEVKKKKCQRRNGFSDWLISRVQTVLQLPNQARYQTSLSPDMKLRIFQMWSNMWSKAILDQSRGEVKKKKCQCRNGFSGWLTSRMQTVLRLSNRGRCRTSGSTGGDRGGDREYFRRLCRRSQERKCGEVVLRPVGCNDAGGMKAGKCALRMALGA